MLNRAEDEGSHEENDDSSGRYELCQIDTDAVNNEWIVYFSERGIKTRNKRFSSEEEACQFNEKISKGLRF